MQRTLKITKSEYNLIEAHSMADLQSGKIIRGVFLSHSDLFENPATDGINYFITVNVELFKNDLITQISKGVDNVIIGGIPTDKIKLEDKKNKMFNNFKSVLSKLNKKI